MTPARLFRQYDEAALAALVTQKGFAVVVGVADGRPLIAQTPVLLDGRRLRFHLSRSNALTPVLATEGAMALVLVAGPDAYISPDWYGIDDLVPTWNYLSVEMEGPVARLEAAAAAVLLDDLSAHHEADLAPKPAWTRGKMTPGRFEAMLEGITAFEMSVDRLEGTWKLGQNKPAEAIADVADQLDRRPGDGPREIARLMRQL